MKKKFIQREKVYKGEIYAKGTFYVYYYKLKKKKLPTRFPSRETARFIKQLADMRFGKMR